MADLGWRRGTKIQNNHLPELKQAILNHGRSLTSCTNTMAEPTYVSFDTSVGPFTVELYTAHAPKVSLPGDDARESRAQARHARTSQSSLRGVTTMASSFTESSL